MRLHKLILITFALPLIIYSCSEPKKKNKNPSSGNKNLNISILLDLSDRIDSIKYPNSTMQFYKRDLGYIQTIASTFSSIMLRKKVMLFDDNLRIFIEPKPMSSKVNETLNLLNNKFKPDSKDLLDRINNLDKYYVQLAEGIYKQAIVDDQYIGSDIWNFFGNKVEDFCIKPKKDNILIIITDGYIYHKQSLFKNGNRSSYLTPQSIRDNNLITVNYKEEILSKDFGFITEVKDLDNLRVLVLGINPSKKNKFDDKIIKTYWGKWFKEMGIKDYKITPAYLPTEMEDIIQQFIKNPKSD